jgi:hypothetical protein
MSTTGSNVSNVHSPVNTLVCHRHRRFFTDFKCSYSANSRSASAAASAMSLGPNSDRTTTNPSRS